MSLTLKKTLLAAASAATLAAGLSSAGHAIPFRDDVGDEGAQEFAAPWDGVVQLYRLDEATGGIFFNCSASLINPRTVISAAHCFDGTPIEDWGRGNGQAPIIAFGPDTFDALFNWIGTDDQFIDDRNGLTFGLDLLVPEGAESGSFNFPGQDMAMIPLLDPLYTLPTYGLLFSPIPEDVFNEGVLVNQIGYGTFHPGSDSTAASINGLRRAGENMLGFLGSFNDFFSTLGQEDNSTPGKDNTQAMYWVDFDLPDRTGECTRGGPPQSGFTDVIECSDWDGFDGTAVDGDTLVLPGPSIDYFEGDALPNEVGTAGGDSGGPLMAMNLGENPLILGVLSGGFLEGFFHASGQSYGELIYYNPVFAYHQFITENNPYKYVTAAAGDGLWSDSAHWSQTLDPNYFVYNDDGQLVNGVPDTQEAGFNPVPPLGTVLGEEAFDLGASSSGAASGDDAANDAADEPVAVVEANDAANLAADGLVATIDPNEATNLAAGGLVATIDPNEATDLAAGGLVATAGAGGADQRSTVVAKESADDAANFAADSEVAQADLGAGVSSRSSAGGASGSGLGTQLTGPGSTDFVPNNSYGALFGQSGPIAFFDVTLSNAGTTTFDLAFAEIDRLSVAGQESVLDILEGNTLAAIAGVETYAGELNVDGLLDTREIVMWGGVLSGDGDINLVDFNFLFGNGQVVEGTLFNVAGIVAPGAIGATGELTINGNYVQTLGGISMFDWSPTGSDVLTVNGDVSLDGAAGIMAVDGYVPTFGDTRTVMTYTGDFVGGFDGFLDIPGALTLTANYLAGAVELEIDAVPYSEIVEFTSPSQAGIATRLTLARDSNYADLADIYGPLDLLAGQNLIDALENLAPHEHYQLRRAVSAHQQMFNRSMFDLAFGGGASGGGQAGAAAGFATQMMGTESRLDLGRASLALATEQAAAGPQVHETGQFRIFGEVGEMNGRFQTTAVSGGGDLEGEFGFVGGDFGVNNWLRVGASLGYADTSSEQALAGGGSARTDVETIEIAGYALATRGDLTGLFRVAGADHSSDQDRVASIGGVLLPAAGGQDGQTLEATLGAAYNFSVENSFHVTPYASITWRETEFDEGEGAGSVAALDLADSLNNELVGRIGANISKKLTLGGAVLEPRAYLGAAADFRTDNETTYASFAAAPGLAAVETGLTESRAGWYEAGASLTAHLRDGFAVSLNYDAIDGRKDVLDVESFSIGARISF